MPKGIEIDQHRLTRETSVIQLQYRAWRKMNKGICHKQIPPLHSSGITVTVEKLVKCSLTLLLSLTGPLPQTIGWATMLLVNTGVLARHIDSLLTFGILKAYHSDRVWDRSTHRNPTLFAAQYSDTCCVAVGTLKICWGTGQKFSFKLFNQFICGFTYLKCLELFMPQPTTGLLYDDLLSTVTFTRSLLYACFKFPASCYHFFNGRGSCPP